MSEMCGMRGMLGMPVTREISGMRGMTETAISPGIDVLPETLGMNGKSGILRIPVSM